MLLFFRLFFFFLAHSSVPTLHPPDRVREKEAGVMQRQRGCRGRLIDEGQMLHPKGCQGCLATKGVTCYLTNCISPSCLPVLICLYICLFEVLHKLSSFFLPCEHVLRLILCMCEYKSVSPQRPCDKYVTRLLHSSFFCLYLLWLCSELLTTSCQSD